jgi:tetratricopeptide (TPR) repeat protein
MRFAWIGLIAALVASSPATAFASSDLEKYSNQLGDPDVRVRDSAIKALRAAGASAGEPLRGVALGPDPEVSRRAAAILRQLDLPAIEEPTLQDPPELAAYRGADRESRGQIISQLIAAGASRPSSLIRAWAMEKDADLRRAMFAAMLQSPPLYASVLVAYGHRPAARHLLETALARGESSAAAPYAALCLLDGDAAAALTRWSARTASRNDAADSEGASADIAASVMARLHRAAGSAKAGIEWARASGDFDLLSEHLRSARDWPALAKLAAEQPNPLGEPGLLNLLCGARILSGEGAALNADIDRLRKLPDATENVSHVLILAGRVDDALRVLTDGAETIDRFKLLIAQERWNDALELLASQDAARDEPAIRFRIAASEQFYALGDSVRANDLLARAATENQAIRSTEIEVLVGEAYRQIGEPAKAWDHFRAAMKSVADRNEDLGPVAWRAFRSDSDGDGEADVGGSNLWGLLQVRFRGEKFDQQFDRARAFVDRTMPIPDLQRLATARGSGSAVGLVYSTHLIRTVGQRMKDLAQEADAEKFLVSSAERAPSPEHAMATFIRLGDWAAEKKDWAKAAHWYGRAWNAERSRAGPLYLRAWAIRQAGWYARADDLMNLAHAIPLADPWRRMESVRFLSQRRVNDALSRETKFILRTSRPDIYAADMAQRLLAERAIRDSDWFEAAALHEGLLLNFASIYSRAEPAFFLRMPHTIHRLRAKGLLARGDAAAAEREIAACRALMPGDVMLAIDVVPEFERLGNKARADGLYAESMRQKDEILAKYPRSANHHNDAAWLAVNCGRDADKALAHARRAVELRPKNASYIDTLAEAQFRRGEIDEAIKAMTRCVELEPKTPRHREQLERFEAAKRGEVRAMPPG